MPTPNTPGVIEKEKPTGHGLPATYWVPVFIHANLRGSDTEVVMGGYNRLEDAAAKALPLATRSVIVSLAELDGAAVQGLLAKIVDKVALDSFFAEVEPE